MFKPLLKTLLRSPTVGQPLLRFATTCRWRTACRFLARQASYRPARVFLGVTAERGAAPRGWMYTADGTDQIALQVWQHGVESFEWPLPRVFLALARQARQVAIVGANSGFYVLLAALTHPAVQVEAFEPLPAAADWLVRNVRANRLERQVRLQRAAVADWEGWADLLVPAKGHGLLETSATLNQAFWPGLSQSLRVPVTTLDSVLGAEADLVLIDVESMEHQVLAGATRTLAEARPFVFVEVLPQAPCVALNRLRERFDYRCAVFAGETLRSRPDLRYWAGNANQLLYPAEKFQLLRRTCARAGIRVLGDAVKLQG